MRGFGFSLYFGPGYVLHWSSEDGFQFERAHHRTWRFGLIGAIRRRQQALMSVMDAKALARRAILGDLMGEAPVSTVGNLRTYHERIQERVEKAMDDWAAA
jgi:hypothetical protein